MRNQKNFWFRFSEIFPRALVLGITSGMVLLALGNIAVAQQTTRRSAMTRPSTVNRSPMLANDHYRLGPGDVLEIRLYKQPELSREALRVEENGTIRMPLINEDIPAVCRTEGELAKDIAARYLKFMRNPQVDVFIKEYHSRPVAVIGAVNAPGRFQLQRRIRLLDLLSYAGGPAERAGGNVQVVHSTAPLACEVLAAGPAGDDNALEIDVYRLNDTLRGEVQSNPYVRPGDVITLLESEQIYVVGNVVRPSSMVLKERITISQAIAMAGGTLPDTRSDRVRIVRQNHRNNARQEIIVDLKAIARRQADDVVLQANDIVEVPTASGKRFLRTLLGTVVPSAARLPMQVIR